MPDNQQVEITGQLLGHDGTPLRRAVIIVHREGFEDATTETLDADGRFGVSVPPGAYSIMIAAVDHQPTWRRTVVTDELRVEGRLGTPPALEPDDALEIRGEYLDGKGNALGHALASATRVAEGVYRLELPSKPEGTVRLRYQLTAPAGGTYEHTMNGPLADDHDYAGGGDFWSIVDVSTRDALDLDLSTRPPANVAPELRWTGEDPTTAMLHAFKARWSEAIDEAYEPQDGGPSATKEERKARVEALAAKAREEIDAETDPVVQALLRAAYVSMFGPYLGLFRDAPALQQQMGWILDHLPPTEPRMVLVHNLDNLVYRTRKDADEALLARTEAWLEARARNSPEPSLAIDALEILLDHANERGDRAWVDELYALVVDPRFEGTFAQTRLKQRYDPDRILMPGKPFPAFDLAGLRDTDPRITNAGRAGHVYLIEFWAVWCSPCVNEMPKLHATYAAINGAQPSKRKTKTKSRDEPLRRLQPVADPRVEFVFVSLDDQPADVEAFRNAQWSMPWTHAFVGHANEDEAYERFGFSIVPTPVLVDEHGVILAEGMELRQDQLLPTLERVLAERRSPSSSSSSSSSSSP